MNKEIKILIKKFLYQEYIINKKSCKEIARENKCSVSFIYNQLKMKKIKIRTISKARQLEFKLKSVGLVMVEL